MKTIRTTRPLRRAFLHGKTIAELSAARVGGFRIGKILIASAAQVRREMDRRAR